MSQGRCGDLSPPLSRVSIAQMIEEQVTLYYHAPPPHPPGWTIPLVVTPFPVVDSVHDKEEISWAVFRLFLDRLGVPSGMRMGHL